MICNQVKVVCAPNSFKGSISAVEAARAMARGVRRAVCGVQVVELPLADGGEGTIDCLVRDLGGRIESCMATGPLRTPVEARFGILDNRTAVIEAAAVCGLGLVPESQRNPAITTSYGVGELIKHVIERGFEEVIVGIGGTSTNDGGTGMAVALGARLLDENGNELDLGGGELHKLKRIDVSGMDPRLKACRFVGACDVNNPLCGPDGASMVFSPQKGATRELAAELDEGLSNFARVAMECGLVESDIRWLPRFGAGGGLAAGLKVFLGAELVSGAEFIAQKAKLAEHIQDAALVITGEGKLDGQTPLGKLPAMVAREAKRLGVPVIAVAGTVEGEFGLFDSCFSLVNGPMSLQQALDQAAELLELATERVMKVWALGAHAAAILKT